MVDLQERAEPEAVVVPVRLVAQAKAAQGERPVVRPDPRLGPVLDHRRAVVLLIGPALLIDPDPLIVLVRLVRAVPQRAATASEQVASGLGQRAHRAVERAAGETIGRRVVQQLMTAGLKAPHSKPPEPGAASLAEVREPPPDDELSGHLERGEMPSRLRHRSVDQTPPAVPRRAQCQMKQPMQNDGRQTMLARRAKAPSSKRLAERHQKPFLEARRVGAIRCQSILRVKFANN